MLHQRYETKKTTNTGPEVHQIRVEPAQFVNIRENDVLWNNPYGLWFIASGARQLRYNEAPLLATHPVPRNGRGRRLVEMTNWC